jgi:hypothetical protein
MDWDTQQVRILGRMTMRNELDGLILKVFPYIHFSLDLTRVRMDGCRAAANLVRNCSK